MAQTDVVDQPDPQQHAEDDHIDDAEAVKLIVLDDEYDVYDAEEFNSTLYHRYLGYASGSAEGPFNKSQLVNELNLSKLDCGRIIATKQKNVQVACL